MLLGRVGMAVYLADYDQLLRPVLRAAEFPPVTDHDRFIVVLLTGMPPSSMATTIAQRRSRGARSRSPTRLETRTA